MTPTTRSSVLIEELGSARSAVAGFRAGYCGATRRSYATDLNVLAALCEEAKLDLVTVRRVHLELFGRWMEANGRMRSTVARHLSNLAMRLAPGGPGGEVRRVWDPGPPDRRSPSRPLDRPTWRA